MKGKTTCGTVCEIAFRTQCHELGRSFVQRIATGCAQVLNCTRSEQAVAVCAPFGVAEREAILGKAALKRSTPEWQGVRQHSLEREKQHGGWHYGNVTRALRKRTQPATVRAAARASPLSRTRNSTTRHPPLNCSATCALLGVRFI